MRKRVVIIFIFILFLIIAISVFILFSFFGIYKIEDNEYQFAINIKQRLNVTGNVDIKQVVSIDNKKIVLFTIDENIGEAEFIRGINKKYKIGATGYGNNLIRYQIVETSKAKYLIMGGQNFELKINRAKVLLENIEYRIDIPQQDYFLTYFIIPNEIQTIFPDIFEVEIYDMSNNIVY